MAYLRRKGLGTGLTYRLWDYALPVFSASPCPYAFTLYRHRFFFPLYSRPASSIVCSSGDVGQDVLISHGILCLRALFGRFALALSSCANVAVVMPRVLKYLVLCCLAILRTGRSSTSPWLITCTRLLT